jgi:tRNA A64-2'-O-ribosylphosphate transferase
MFWKNHQYILSNQAECEEKVKYIVASSKDVLLEEGETDGKNFAMIEPTMLGIGNYASGKPPHCWEHFDYIINCSVSEYNGMDDKKYLHLPIPDGKKGQIIFGTSIQKAIDFVHDPIMENKKILVHCATGNKCIIENKQF